MRNRKSIGVPSAAPSQACTDSHCPIHGHLKVRGRQFKGVITSSKMSRTVIVEWDRQHFIPKYERYERRRTKLKVHNPACINATEGDIVIIMETKPISKTKSFVVIQTLGKEKDFIQKMEGRESAKVKEKEEPKDKEGTEKHKKKTEASEDDSDDEE